MPSKDPIHRREVRRAWYLSHKQHEIDQAKKWHKDNTVRYDEIHKKHMSSLKSSVIEAYGGKCCVCGSKTDLCLHHTNRDGRLIREKLGITNRYAQYRDLRDRGFPQDEGIVVMCMQCHRELHHGRR